MTRVPSGETCGAKKNPVVPGGKWRGPTSRRSLPSWSRSQISATPLRSVTYTRRLPSEAHAGISSLRFVAIGFETAAVRTFTVMMSS
jgi:hypothetical protein